MQATLFQAFRFSLRRNTEKYKCSRGLHFTKKNMSFFFSISTQEVFPFYQNTAASYNCNKHSSLLPTRHLSHAAKKPTGTRTEDCLQSKRHVAFAS